MVNFYKTKGIVVHTHYFPALYKFCSLYGVFGIHCKVVSYGQYCKA